MNNEEPIKASHYPDGVVPEIENTDTTQSGENGEVTTDGAAKKRRRKNIRNIDLTLQSIKLGNITYAYQEN